MKTHTQNWMYSGIARVFLGTALVLLVPLTAKLLVAGFNWGVEDFLVIGGLLLGAGLAYEVGVKTLFNNARSRMMAGAVIVFTVLFIWAELAVGIFTQWGN